MAEPPSGGDPPPDRPRLTFAPERRIRRRADFQRAYREGRKLRGRHLMLFCLPRPVSPGAAPPPWRLGITATRKTGGAVVRNRIKRRAREIFRLRQHEIPPGWDFVLHAAPSMASASPEGLTEDLAVLLRKLERQTGPPAPRREGPA